MTGAQRQARYMARLRQEAGRVPGGQAAAARRASSSRRLTWRTKEREAHAETADGGEYQITLVPETGVFELSYYDDTGRLDLLPDEYLTIEAAKVAAERHHAQRWVRLIMPD